MKLWNWNAKTLLRHANLSIMEICTMHVVIIMLFQFLMTLCLNFANFFKWINHFKANFLDISLYKLDCTLAPKIQLICRHELLKALFYYVSYFSVVRVMKWPWNKYNIFFLFSCTWMQDFSTKSFFSKSMCNHTTYHHSLLTYLLCSQ